MYACVRYVSSAFGSLQLFCVHRPRARVLCVQTAVAAVSMFSPARPAASSQPNSHSGLFGWIGGAVRGHSRTAAVSDSDRHTAAVSDRSGGAETVHPEPHPEPPGLEAPTANAASVHVNAAGSDRSSGDQSLLEKTLNAASEVFCRRPQGSWEPWGNPMDEAVDDRQFVPREEEEEEEVEHASDREDSWGRPMDELPDPALWTSDFEDCAERVRGRHSEPTRGTNSCTSGPCWADAAPDVEVPAAWQGDAPPDMEEPAPSRRRVQPAPAQLRSPVDSDGSDSDAGSGETVGELTEDDIANFRTWRITARHTAKAQPLCRVAGDVFEGTRGPAARNSKAAVGNFGLLCGNWGKRSEDNARDKVSRANREAHDRQVLGGPAQIVVILEATPAVAALLEQEPTHVAKPLEFQDACTDGWESKLVVVNRDGQGFGKGGIGPNPAPTGNVDNRPWFQYNVCIDSHVVNPILMGARKNNCEKVECNEAACWFDGTWREKKHQESPHQSHGVHVPLENKHRVFGHRD